MTDWTDEDAAYLRGKIAKRLMLDYGHTHEVAESLIRQYFERFTDPGYCARNNIGVQNMEFFFREESFTMADRIQFYVVLDNPVNESAFIAWERKVRSGFPHSLPKNRGNP